MSETEEPAHRGEDGDIVGGETKNTDDTEMGTGQEGDISHGDGGMGAGRGADIDEERQDSVQDGIA